MTYNLRRELEAAEAQHGEPIEAMVVGKHDDRWMSESHQDENVVLSREDGLKKVDLDYHNGYGGADCYPLYAWTRSRVFFVSEYDGATSLDSVPRHPIACEVKFQ